MKNLWKMWIFIAQFHFQDPDPDSAYGSGFRIRIQPGNLTPDPPGSGSETQAVPTYHTIRLPKELWVFSNSKVTRKRQNQNVGSAAF